MQQVSKLAIIISFLGLTALVLVSDWMSHRFLPLLPGPLLGLLLMYVFLLVVPTIPASLQVVCEWLLKHLPIFFVPPFVAAWLYADLLTAYLGWVLLSIFASSALSMIVVGVMIERLQGESDEL